MTLPTLPLDTDAFSLFAGVFYALNPPAVRTRLLGMDLDEEELPARELGRTLRPNLASTSLLTSAEQDSFRIELDSGNQDRMLRAAWRLLIAIDWASQDFSLLRRRTGMAAELSERLEHERKLNPSGPGLVLPKACPTPASNNILIRNLHNPTWASTGGSGYEVDYDILPSHEPGSAKTAGDPCSIGYVRAARDHDDLRASSVERAGAMRYSVRPNPDKREMRTRIEEGIKELAERGTDIIILPESVVDEDIFAAISDCLRAMPAGTNPIVVAGTRLVPNGGGPARSRCTALAGQGRISWHQDKLNPYNMSRETVEVWGLADSVLVGPDDLAHEDIAPEAARVAVRDTSLGRIVILICQDLSASDELIQLVEHLSPNHLIVPVLDRTAGAFWQAANAAARTSFVGATYVCNSHFIYATQIAAQKVAPPPPAYAFYNVRFPSRRPPHGDNRTSAHNEIFYI